MTVIKNRSVGPTSPDCVLLGIYKCKGCGNEYEVLTWDAKCTFCNPKKDDSKAQLKQADHMQTLSNYVLNLIWWIVD